MMKWIHAIAFSISVAAIAVAGRFSADDGELFLGRPYIVIEEGIYYIQWTQGQWPFAFFPESKIKEGKAIFEVKGTSSSGNLVGKVRREEIKRKKIREAIDSNGAFWREPDGTLIKLEIKNRSLDLSDRKVAVCALETGLPHAPTPMSEALPRVRMEARQQGVTRPEAILPYPMYTKIDDLIYKSREPLYNISLQCLLMEFSGLNALSRVSHF